MPDSFTPNLNLVKPEINQSAETWGIKLNSDLDVLDTFAGTLNTFISGNDAHIKALIAAAIPRGIIVAWSGGAGSIPTGWLLCNGANGTPNLTDRFILGNTGSRANWEAGGSFGASAVTDTRGNHSHTGNTTDTTLDISQVPAHQHGGNTDVQGNHHHTIPRRTSGAGSNEGLDAGGGAGSLAPWDGTSYTGDHSHNIVTDWRGGGAPHHHGIIQDGTHTHNVSVSVVPPYFSLAYIMRA